MDQQMRLAPRIIQAMEILQLPMMALQERIEAELQANPVLELREPSQEEETAEETAPREDERGEKDMVVSEADNSGDFERLADFEAEFGAETLEEAPSPAPWRSQEGERDRKMDAMANTPAPAVSLGEYLLDQWAFVEAPDEVKSAGRLIIENIGDDGYLRVSMEDLAVGADPPASVEILRQALALVQTLDPQGVGARDLKECLALQLQVESQAGRDVSLEMELVGSFLKDIELNRLPHIVKKTGKSIEAIKTAIDNISHLNPRPGHLIGQRSAPVISPDIFLSMDDAGQVRIDVPEGDMPKLRISRTYRKLVQERKADVQTRQFIQKNVRAAQWLIEAIQQRRTTVRRVAEEVFAVQRNFLDLGPQALKPLPMADVAKKVGVHVATVSRAVSGKYVQTPLGIYPLRMFFTGGTTTDQGQDMAWDAVRVKLKEIVDAEDKNNPLNDDQLAAELVKHGLKVARRTVAKYRGLLDISPARQRIKY